MANKKQRQSRTPKRPAPRRNPDDVVEHEEEQGRRRRNPLPKTTVAELAANVGLIRSDGRPLTEVSTWFLAALDQDLVRWHPKSGEPLVIGSGVKQAASALTALYEAGACLAREDYWVGCPAPQAARRNPFIGIHVDPEEETFQDDLAELEDLDYLSEANDD